MLFQELRGAQVCPMRMTLATCSFYDCKRIKNSITCMLTVPSLLHIGMVESLHVLLDLASLLHVPVPFRSTVCLFSPI